MARAILALLPLAQAYAEPLALSSSAKEALSAAAADAPLPQNCPGMDDELTDNEKDFVVSPYWKYFTYDTFDKRSWVTLENLEACMRTVPGGDTNPWVMATDLWEAHVEIYKKLGASTAPSMWWKQGWIEREPVQNFDSVLGTAFAAAAPMSSMGTAAWLQQPCNALSNAAFFEVSLMACNAASVDDYGGSFPWRSEIIAAGALMAFGSFAMHGNPSGGAYHEYSGSTEVDSSRDMAYDTAMFDRYSMDVLFFVFFQANVRAMAADPQDANLKRIIGLVKDDRLCALNDDCTYGDSRAAIHIYQQILGGPVDQWKDVIPLRDTVPEYKVAATGLVLVSLRAIISDELFGSAAAEMYTMLCNQITLALVTPEDLALQAQAQFCGKDTDWVQALNKVTWKIPKDIAKAMAVFVSILESLIEAMYWQETLVSPANYLDPYLERQVVNISSCWRQTHGNWHRVAAQMMKELMKFLTNDLYTLTTPSMTAAEKQAAWGSITMVASEFIIFVNALKMMKDASQINICRVFRAAKEVAGAGQEYSFQVMPILDAAGVNQLLTKQLEKSDPLSLDLNVEQSVKDPTGGCNYKLENVKLDELRGLSNLALEDFAVTGEYVDESSFDNTAVKYKAGVRTCPLSVKVKASADFTKNGGKLGFICNKLTWRTEVEVDITFQ
ncbi:unnamed protein product, partial [Effrenium voratum]